MNHQFCACYLQNYLTYLIINVYFYWFNNYVWCFGYISDPCSNSILSRAWGSRHKLRILPRLSWNIVKTCSSFKDRKFTGAYTMDQGCEILFIEWQYVFVLIEENRRKLLLMYWSYQPISESRELWVLSIWAR